MKDEGDGVDDEARYTRLLRAIAGEPLPAALVDVDALEKNVARFVEPARAHKKTLRVATKSIRSIDLLELVFAAAGDVAKGVLAYSVREASYLASRGFDDVIVAYPTALPSEAALAAKANAKGARIALVADDEVHLEVAARAAADEGVRVPIVVDADVSYRPVGDRVSIGARRSPLHGATRVADFVERVVRRPDLTFAGLLAYEAHIAGVADDAQGSPVVAAATRAMKRRAIRDVAEQRLAIEREIHRRGIAIPLFNGGGTGSIDSSTDDASLTEIAVGSGFLASHLFDGYRGLGTTPAAFFALQVTRLPSEGFATCHGGGYIASGAVGPSRLPIPVHPRGLTLTSLEGAGEVQTPLALPRGTTLVIGSPVLFRHAKAGELAEHFDAYALVRNDAIVGRAKTYRGDGQAFG